MKLSLTFIFVLGALAATTIAGNFGPGPWNNGAYYPNQFDGVYSAVATGTNLSGVIGFALENGSPTTSGAGDGSIAVDTTQNYFVIYADGVTFAGATIGTINIEDKKVAGGLFNGVGPTQTIVTTSGGDIPVAITNTTTLTGSGGFNAKLTSQDDVTQFVGNSTGQFTVGVDGNPFITNVFSVNGIKVSDTTTSASAISTATPQ